jgi:hypothetical protein
VGQLFPALPEGHACVLVLLPAPLVPHVAGSMRELEEREYWFSDADHESGYNAIAEVYICMATGCLTELVEAQNRLYRLLDTQLTGTEYAASELDGVITVLPPIPAAPPPPLRSFHSRLERLEHLLDNAYNGQQYLPDFGDTDSVRDLLRALIIAVQETDDLDDDLLAKLTEVAYSVS